VRLNQEHGDRLWILGVYATVEDAAWWEAWFSAQYGLPTVCFHDVGRRLALGQRDRSALRAVDTRSRGKELLEDLDLLVDFPHLVPQGGHRRQTLNLTMYSDARGPVGSHRVQWSSNRADIAERLRRAGLPVRPGKLPGTHRLETSRSSLADAQSSWPTQRRSPVA
jgi:DNA helicase II / ATP-dependent DNA helicase PcrA